MEYSTTPPDWATMAEARSPYVPVITKRGCVEIDSVTTVIDHDDMKVLRFDTDIKRVTVGVSYGREVIADVSYRVTEVYIGVMEGEPEYDPNATPTVVHIPQGAIVDNAWWISDYHWDKYGFYLTMFRAWGPGIRYQYVDKVPVIEGKWR